MAFSGFGPELVDFYDGLAADNSREYWLGHRQVWERAVRLPLEALAAELRPEFGEIKMFRPNRDLRFTSDKRPYQEHASFATTGAAGSGAAGSGAAGSGAAGSGAAGSGAAGSGAAGSGGPGSGGLYFQIAADELLVGGGWWRPATADLNRWRRLQDSPDAARSLDRLLADLTRRGYPLGDGDPVATAPRGWARDHPRIELLRRRSLTVGRSMPLDERCWSAAAAELVRDGWRQCSRWNSWLDSHLRG